MKPPKIVPSVDSVYGDSDLMQVFVEPEEDLELFCLDTEEKSEEVPKWFQNGIFLIQNHTLKLEATA